LRYEIESLPASPLAAAKSFHATHLDAIEATVGLSEGSLIIIFPAADQDHRGWRLAAIQDLARANAPIRVNAVESGHGPALLAACDYIENAPGLTGQLLRLDGSGLGALLSSGT
jgi:hypothetical protein